MGTIDIDLRLLGGVDDWTTAETDCAARSGSTTICQRPFQVVTQQTRLLLGFRVKRSVLLYNKFRHCTVFNFNVATNVLHLRNKNIMNTSDRRLLYMMQVSVYFMR